mmetsp:Transcript_31450/g.83789  ORF Transcript_31450/g.83789 Transcript_31450/m.83789 type:complete len:233 (+) Transcript_31450:453-1151(+)
MPTLHSRDPRSEGDCCEQHFPSATDVPICPWHAVHSCQNATLRLPPAAISLQQVLPPTTPTLRGSVPSKLSLRRVLAPQTLHPVHARPRRLHRPRPCDDGPWMEGCSFRDLSPSRTPRSRNGERGTQKDRFAPSSRPSQVRAELFWATGDRGPATCPRLAMSQVVARTTVATALASTAPLLNLTMSWTTARENLPRYSRTHRWRPPTHRHLCLFQHRAPPCEVCLPPQRSAL